MATPPNRSAARQALATLLETELTGVGNPVQAVYNHKPDDLEGQSPVVAVASASSTRIVEQGFSPSEYAVSTFDLAIMVFVLYSDESQSWTRENAEDRIDLIESEIARVMIENYSQAGDWIGLRQTAPSQVLEVTVGLGGTDYLLEIFPISLEVT